MRGILKAPLHVHGGEGEGVRSDHWLQEQESLEKKIEE